MAQKVINESNYQDYTKAKGGQVASTQKNYCSGLNYPNIDGWYGPYSSKLVAHKMLTRHFENYDEGTLDEAPDLSASIPQGLTVAVLEGNPGEQSIVEYQYKKATPADGYSVNDLEKKYSDAEIDDTLTQQGKAADAKKVGDKLGEKYDKSDMTVHSSNMLKVKIGNKYYVVPNLAELVTPANPTFSGTTTFNGSGSVTISTATAGASIKYTMDGTEPSLSNGTLYTTAIGLDQDPNLESKSYTIKAIAILNGMVSEVTSQTYTVNRKLANPSISVGGDAYVPTESRNVTISGPSGATLRYTTDGTNPTSESTVYTGPIPVSTNGTVIKAIATDANDEWVASDVATQTVELGKLPMWTGLVDDAPATDSAVMAMTRKLQDNLPLTYSISSSEVKKVCIAYKKSLGQLDLTKVGSIMNSSGMDCSGDFVASSTDSYYVYTSISAADNGGLSYTFKKL